MPTDDDNADGGIADHLSEDERDSTLAETVDFKRQWISP
jgi:hypothetical protein